MAENAFNIPNGFNLGMQPQHHNPNQQQQQPHIPPGVTSPQNGPLWNELQRYASQVQHTQQLNQNATKMLYQSQGPHMQQGLQQNQLANANPLTLQQLRLNPQAAAAVAAARQNQQGGAGLNPGLLGVGAPSAPTGANSNPYNVATGQLSSHFGPSFAALSRAKPDTRIFPSGPNAPPNGPQQQQQQQQQSGVPGMPGLGLANGGAGNGGGGGGPVEALRNQIAAQRLTPQQFTNIAPHQREHLRQLLENQQQQQAFANAQAQHQLQQQQQTQQPPQQQSQQPQPNQLQFNNGQGQQQQQQQQQQGLGGQMPGLGQMGQQATGFPGGQQTQLQVQGAQSNGQDGAAFLENIISLPMEAFRNQLIVLKSKMKAFEEQRDRCLQIKTPQALQEAQKLHAQVNGLQNLMQQLTEAYTRRQAANMGIQPQTAAGPSGQQSGQPPAMGPPGSNQGSGHNRPGMTQGTQDGPNAQNPLGWPANMAAAQQLNRERLQALANARAAAVAQQVQQQNQQQQGQQQNSVPPRVPSTQPNQPLHTSPQVNQQPQPGPSNRQVQFHEFFTTAFNGWLTQRQLTLDPPRVDGKEVELHKLFLMVGALGGCRAVFEKKFWPVVGAKIGFPYYNGPMPYSKPEVAEQLSKIYQKILADFEVHWHSALRPRDPNSIFPLPPQLQYLHPEIEKLATAQFPLPPPHQQGQRPVEAGPPHPPDGNARGPTPNQMSQQTPQMGQSQAATHQQEALIRNQPVVAFPPQPGAPPGMANLPQLQGPLQQLVNNPETQKLSPEELKRRGLSDEIIQRVIMYRHHNVARTTQGRKEQEMQQQQQQRQMQAQATGLLNPQKENTQMPPHMQPQGPGGAQQLGPGGANSFQPSALPHHANGPQLPASGPTLPGLNVPQEQLMKAQEKVRAAIGLFHNKGDYSSISLSPEQGILLEQSIQQTQSLLKQVAQNLISFVVLAPNDERELHQVARTVVTLSDQAQILQKSPPERRFIFGLGDLNQYRNHLTTFLMRVKGLQSQALAHQQNSGPPPPNPPPAAPLQPPVQAPMRPPTAELPRPPIPTAPVAPITQPQLPQQVPVAAPPKQSIPPPPPVRQPPVRKPMPSAAPAVSTPSPAASTPINQAPTPAPAGSPDTPKSPAIGPKGATGKAKTVTKSKPPPKRVPTKPTPKIPPAEVPGSSRPEIERPPSKRDREDDATGPDGSAGPNGSPKRIRTDPQEDLDTKRNADLAVAKQLSIEGSLDFLEKTVKEYEKVAATAAPGVASENGGTEQNPTVVPTIESLLQMLDQGALYDFSAEQLPAVPGLAAQSHDALVSAPGVKSEEDDWLWAIDSSQWATEDPAVGETPELVQSVSSQGPTPNSDGEPDTHTASVALTATPVVPKVEASVTEGPDFWASIGVPEGRYFSDDTEWKWEGKMESNGEWPISYPNM